MYKKILVPLDGSELCANALEPAEELARLAGAEIILYHVVPHATIYTDKEGSFCDFCEPDQSQQSVVEKYLSRKRDDLQAKGVKASFAIEMGENPARKIVDFAKRNLISLIVLTTHGRSGFTHLFMGSVAEKVAREGSEYSSVLIERCQKC
ncbi:MAG: Universal stress protein family protein [Syntrophus sp. PtaU1.Bin208]|nr:MAG: Universal stress protein family protein [Syntrophus sp. PtaU1.Bin208]